MRYSTLPRYVGQRVWCRVHGSELVITARTQAGLAEIARHQGAVELAAVVGPAAVDHALGLAAIAGCFGDDDQPAITDHLAVSGAAGKL